MDYLLEKPVPELDVPGWADQPAMATMSKISNKE
jgi:hypothetical protein